MFGEANKEELYRRLAQARRMSTPGLDPTTKERVEKLISDLEAHLAAIEAKVTDAPPE